MPKKSTTLDVALPRCRFCGRSWLPAEGVSASHSYCDVCADERRAAAFVAFGACAPDAHSTMGSYLLPRHLRRS
jgi:hypothetical protein